MLSILIPVYNHNIGNLVSGLHRQASEQLIDFEIIIAEDGSNCFVGENAQTCQLPHCTHIVLAKNIGRSAMRNFLADKARYNHLLFMDCDAEIPNEHYIEKYLAFCHEEVIVIGGTAYADDNNQPQYSLRLKYGRKREARPANLRSKNNFATFNFLITKNIFNQVRFNEGIKGYGHEDMLFGHQLKLLKQQFIQIDNPLIHIGLDDNKSFIRKTEEATNNLFLLYKSNKFPQLSDESNLLRTFIFLENTKLNRLGKFLFSKCRKPILRQLNQRLPSLALFDIYKLLFMCEISLKK